MKLTQLQIVMLVRFANMPMPDGGKVWIDNGNHGSTIRSLAKKGLIEAEDVSMPSYPPVKAWWIKVTDAGRVAALEAMMAVAWLPVGAGSADQEVEA